MDADPNREIDVSIVICTRNRANRLSGTLGALRALRTSHGYEVIWVDNASTDDTAAVLQREIAHDAVSRYILGTRVGLGAARNLGWENARGRIVAFTDDDCYPSSDFVDAILAAFADHPGAGVIGGRILLHNPNHARITIEESDAPRVYPKRTFVRAGTLQGANLAFRREALQAIGGIDPELGAGTRFPCEDIDAVTAVLWAGFDACFDPRPTVQHDHGRVEADVPALLNSYDRGRGSYYAKYILRPDTRTTFVLRWLSSTWRRRDWQGLRTLQTELQTAAQYAIAKRRFGALALAFPLGLIALTVQSIVSYGFSSGRRLRETKGR